jgi:hypothetical protein
VIQSPHAINLPVSLFSETRVSDDTRKARLHPQSRCTLRLDPVRGGVTARAIRRHTGQRLVRCPM